MMKREVMKNLRKKTAKKLQSEHKSGAINSEWLTARNEDNVDEIQLIIGEVDDGRRERGDFVSDVSDVGRLRR